MNTKLPSGNRVAKTSDNINTKLHIFLSNKQKLLRWNLYLAVSKCKINPKIHFNMVMHVITLTTKADVCVSFMLLNQNIAL